MAQWLIEGLTATISGVLTVFLVLILIAFLISQLKYIDKLTSRKRKAEGSRNTIEANTVFRTTAPKEDVIDDLELVAILTAAVAASLNTTTDQLVVKSIRRADSSRRRL